MIAKKKRGRPRGFDVEQAIAMAMDLFHRHGYDGVGVAELSKTIGITAPSLYSAFGSKRELFEQVLQRYVRGDGCWLPKALAIGDTLEAAIFNLFVQAAENYAANPEKPGCLVMDSTRNCNDAEVQSITTSFRDMTRQLICDRITTSELNLTESQVDLLANYTVMILVGLSGSARDGMNAHALKATAEIAATGFVRQLEQYYEVENNVSPGCVAKTDTVKLVNRGWQGR